MAYARLSTITIAAPVGSLTDFTVKLYGTLADLKTVANGGYVQNTVTRVGVTCPADFIISTSSGGTPISSFGWVKYVATTGEYEINVKIASYTAGMTLYAMFGDAAVVTYQGGAQGAEFDANTQAVYPLPDGTTLSAKDFSANANDGTLLGPPTATTGKINGGVNFVKASSQRISLGNPASLQITGSITLSTWVKLTTNADGMIIAKDKDSGGRAYVLDHANFVNKFRFYVNGGGNLALNEVRSTTLPSTGTWYHLTATLDTSGSGTMKIFVNGVAETTLTPSSTSIPAATANVLLGGREYTGFLDYLNGNLDNVTIANAARSATWIATDYATQNSPATIGASTPNISGAATSLSLLGCQ
jgi:hypothetical protein